MSTMGRYCKAYPASMLRTYSKWSEKAVPPPSFAAESDEGEGEPLDLTEDPCFFIQENLIVTNDVFLDEGIVFDEITPEWERFCREELGFVIPEDELPEAAPPATSESALNASEPVLASTERAD